MSSGTPTRARHGASGGSVPGHALSSPGSDVSSIGIPTGNTYDKYGTNNPAARRIVSRFQATVDGLLVGVAPESILDVGCGEGVLTERWAARLGDGRVAGVDLDDALLQAHWEQRRRPNLEFLVARGEALPFADDEFDVATAIEVLEHVDDPPAAIAQMARCARRI